MLFDQHFCFFEYTHLNPIRHPEKFRLLEISNGA